MMIRGLLDFLIPLIWLLLAVAVVVYFVITRRRHGTFVALRRLYSIRLLLPLLVVISLSVIRASLVFVYPQEIGVVISIFSPGGIRNQPMRAGLHWIIPLAEKVIIYPIAVQSYTMSGRPGEGKVIGDDAIQARTADGQLVIMDVTTFFRVNPEEVIDLHIQWQDRYVDQLLRPALRALTRNEVAQYTVNEVNSEKRVAFLDSLNETMVGISEHSGLIIIYVMVRNITFSPDYAKSVEKKQMAHQGIMQTRYEAQQIENLAKGHAERIKITAEAEAAAIRIEAAAIAEARVVKAEADAKALRLVGEVLEQRSDLLTYRYIEKLSPNIKAMLLPSKTPLILPIPRLDGQAETPEPVTLEAPRPAQAPTFPGVMPPPSPPLPKPDAAEALESIKLAPPPEPAATRPSAKEAALLTPGRQR